MDCGGEKEDGGAAMATYSLQNARYPKVSELDLPIESNQNV